VVLVATVLAACPPAEAFHHPTAGRWLQRDPGPAVPTRVGSGGMAAGGQFVQRDPYADGMNLYQYVGGNPPRQLDPSGEAIVVLGGEYDVDVNLLQAGNDRTARSFANKVRGGFQEVIGDCAKLRAEDDGRRPVGGAIVPQLRIAYSSEKPGCRCDDCWQTLKRAIDNAAPVIQIRYLQDKSNAYAANVGILRDVLINPGVNAPLPERDRRGTYRVRRAPFSIVLWHEAIGHGFLGTGHPRIPENTAAGWDGVFVDPTIAEENRARNCTRLLGKRYGGFFGLFGRRLGDRHPAYYP